MRTSILRQLLASLVAGFVLLLPALGQAQTPSFKVISVDALGCNSGDFDMTVERANLVGSYTVRTVVTVGALIYMNEAASVSTNGFSNWSIFNNFTYGAVPNPGTYPIPSGQQMRLDFTLEQPQGTVLNNWTLIVDGCNTGNILYNGPTAAAASLNAIPAVDPAGLAVLGLAILAIFAWRQRPIRVRK